MQVILRGGSIKILCYSFISLFQNVDFIYNKAMDFLRNDFDHLTQNDEDYQDNYLKKYSRF